MNWFKKKEEKEFKMNKEDLLELFERFKEYEMLGENLKVVVAENNTKYDFLRQRFVRFEKLLTEAGLLEKNADVKIEIDSFEKEPSHPSVSSGTPKKEESVPCIVKFPSEHLEIDPEQEKVCKELIKRMGKK